MKGYPIGPSRRKILRERERERGEEGREGGGERERRGKKREVNRHQTKIAHILNTPLLRGE